jgi:hypothetical protein
VHLINFSAKNPRLRKAAKRYKQAEENSDTMTMKFLLHKDNKENATAQMVHLFFADTHPNAEKPKEPFFAKARTNQHIEKVNLTIRKNIK